VMRRQGEEGRDLVEVLVEAVVAAAQRSTP
jgi:hypothetical protein